MLVYNEMILLGFLDLQHPNFQSTFGARLTYEIYMAANFSINKKRRGEEERRWESGRLLQWDHGLSDQMFAPQS